MRGLGTTFLTLLTVLCLAPTVTAHGGDLGSPVESRFQVPAWVTWAVGGLVVAVSFLVVAGYLSARPQRGQAAKPEDSSTAAGLTVGRGVGLFVLAIVALSGLLSTETPLAATTLWILVWAGFAVASYCAGDVWSRVNPFLAMAAWADAARGGRTPLNYPTRLGAWPAVSLLLLLTWLEVSVAGAHTNRVGLFVAAYALFTFAGMLLFGSDAWLSRAEVFTRSLAWWAHAAPRDKGRWTAPGARLPRLRTDGAGDVAFAVALLYAVNYDGLAATSLGARVRHALEPALGTHGATISFLVLGFAAFLTAYWAAAAWIARAAPTLEPSSALAARFAPALVPIAVGYHAAHNLVYVLENAPRLALAWTDPFGLGWTEGDAMSAVLPSGWAAAVVGLQMALILAGHVLAVVVAHKLAFAGFPSRLQAVRGEVPLTLVMVAYTLVGLWILGQAAAGVNA